MNCYPFRSVPVPKSNEYSGRSRRPPTTVVVLAVQLLLRYAQLHRAVHSQHRSIEFTSHHLHRTNISHASQIEPVARRPTRRPIGQLVVDNPYECKRLKSNRYSACDRTNLSFVVDGILTGSAFFFPRSIFSRFTDALPVDDSRTYHLFCSVDMRWSPGAIREEVQVGRENATCDTHVSGEWTDGLAIPSMARWVAG